MPHAHILPARDDLAVAAQAALQAAGEQWTGMRASVYAALASFDRPASAYDVAELVSKRQDRRVAANSVYRILDLFVARNLVQRIESANAYVVNAHPACVHDCIFLVCDGCGRIAHVDDDTLSRKVRAAARSVGFTPVRPIVEVRGYCAGCASA